MLFVLPTVYTVSPYNVTKPKSHPTVSVQALEVAVQQCERLLAERLHQDIDEHNEVSVRITHIVSATVH